MLTVVEKVIVLQNVNIFAEVPTEQLSLLAVVAEEVSYTSESTVYKENDIADALYLVLEGKVILERNNNEIAVADSGEAFGTWALFDEEPRVVTARVKEDCHLLRIDREDFVDLLADHVQIAQGILKTMVNRLRGLVERTSH